MSAFTAAACRLLNYRCQITSLGIVRKARCVIPGNGFHREISTTCYRLSDDDKSGVDLKQGVKKTPDVKAQVFTHGSAAVHNQICKSLFGDSAQKLLKIMSENKNRFKMVPGKDNIEVIATSEERLEQAKQLVEKEVEDIKSKLSFAKDPLYEEKLLFDWDSAIPSKEVRRKFIGVKGNNVQQLVNQFESKVFIQVRKDHIMIKGTDEELVKAASAKVKEELKEIVSQLESSPLPEVVPTSPLSPPPSPPSPPPQPVKKKRVFAARVDVQEDYVKEIGGRIIGVKGTRIQQLQKQAGFHLNISSGHDYIEVEVEDEANLEKAVKLMEKEIEHILSNKTTMVPKDTDGGPSRTRNIEVGEEMDKIFSRLIGKSGSYVNRLRQQIGVNFILNKQDSSTLVIGATNQAELDVAVERVLKEIEIIKKNGFGRDKDGGPSRTRNIQIEEGMDRIFSRLIGKGGSNVNRLRQQIGVHFSINRPDSSTIVIGTTNPAELDIAVEQVTKEIEVLKQDSYADSQDSLIDPSLTRSIQVDSDKSNIFSRLIGKKGENVNRLRQQIGTDFSINIRDDSIVVGVKNPADLDVAFEKVEKEIETIKQARKGATRFARTETSVDWDKVLNGEMERLGIFEKSDLNKESPRIECPLWDKLEAEEARERKRAFHVNNFDRMISLTEEGKLWKFPINNDQGWTEEEDVSFGEHVFLDHLIEDFPKKGPVRHFMELVIAGLSKNPHMSVKEKHDHINWYRTYFMENEDLMREELGEEHGTIREQLGQQV